MENIDRKFEQASEEDLDRILDAALAKHASAEPRPGLEDRILAKVRSDAVPTTQHAWWYFGIAVALAAILLAAAINRRSPKLFLESARRTAPARPNPSAMDPPKLNPDAGRSQPQTPIHIAKTTATPVGKPRVPKNPKLDVFPSPHPLSEQEQMLARYVAQFNDEAVIVARVRSEGMRLDREKEMQEAEQSGNQYPKAR